MTYHARIKRDGTLGGSVTEKIDYAAKGREVARLAQRGSWDGNVPDRPAAGYVRIVGCDLTKMTEAQAKELADAYREAIKPASRRG